MKLQSGTSTCAAMMMLLALSCSDKEMTVQRIEASRDQESSSSSKMISDDIEHIIDDSSMIVNGAITRIGDNRYNSDDGTLKPNTEKGGDYSFLPMYNPYFVYGEVVIQVRESYRSDWPIEGIVSFRIDDVALNQRATKNVFAHSDVGEVGIGMAEAAFHNFHGAGTLDEPYWLTHLFMDAEALATNRGGRHVVVEFHKWLVVNNDEATDSVTGQTYSLSSILDMIKSVR